MNNLKDLVEQWNQQVVIDPLAVQRARELQQELVRRGVVYRFNPERQQRLQRLVPGWKSGSAAREVKGTSGVKYTELPLQVALRPAFLTSLMEQKVADIGQLLLRVIDASEELVRCEEIVRSLVAVTSRAEAQGIGVQPPHRHYAPWVRIDYLWTLRAGSEPHPVVVDVNLLPGGGHIMGSELSRIFIELIYPCYGSVEQVAGFQPASLYEVIRDEFSSWRERTGSSSSPSAAFVVREGHGLEPDVKLWAQLFSAHTGIPAAVVYPDQIESSNGSDVITKHGVFNLIVRQVRPVTKHVEVGRLAAEDRGIAILLDAYKRGEAFVFPGFHLYLENHAWAYLWRHAIYGSFFRARLGPAVYLRLYDYLPRTAIAWEMGPEPQRAWHGTLGWDDGYPDVYQGALPDGLVIKRGDSTGAEQLQILYDSSFKYKQRAYEFIQRNWRDVIVAQELVAGLKETYPVVQEGGNEVKLVTGHMKYSAYFVNGEYIGGSAMMCPSSRKVHGGKDTYLMPIYTLRS